MYTASPPARIKDEVMMTNTFYVERTREGIKTAAFLEHASLDERCRLFKIANDLEGNLAKALQRMEDNDALDEEDFDIDDFDEEEFTTLDDDSSAVEDDEEDDFDEEEFDSEEDDEDEEDD